MLQSFLAELTADTAGLVATERYEIGKHGYVIDRQDAGTDPVGDGARPLYVGGVNCSGEAIITVIRDANGLVISSTG